MEQMTLTEVLAVIGFSHRPSESYHHQKDIVDTMGRVVFTGTAHDVWSWLRGDQESGADVFAHWPIDAQTQEVCREA